jgi:GT2 family glycosyltransferase/2-polyprenyl-3-methyl-5-hydroxy-6-metoxy-1,4-benzoquinol methylase/spore maturation protein CgeB/Tfp pilus assembly protein PilF
MHRLKILTFNWHDPYIYLLAQTGHDIHVGDWMQRADGTRGWDLRKRPVPTNVTLLDQQVKAVAGLQGGRFDLAIAHTLQDIAFLERFDVPAVFLTHNALQNDGQNDPRLMGEFRQSVQTFLATRRSAFAAISQMKLDSWGLGGFIVKPGIPLEDYDGFEGSESRALSVGNLFVERDFMLGYSAIAEGLDGMPHHLVGVNPSLPGVRQAEDWDELRSFYRSHRVYVNATVEAFEDGYNLGMLEAMATGMPVVTTRNATSPIVDGQNGFVCDTPGQMRECVQKLLDEPDLARILGSRARETVHGQFSVEVFVSTWNAIFADCLCAEPARRATSDGRVAGSCRLEVSRDDLFPYTREDVVRLLATANLEGISIPRIKLDRTGNGHLVDVSLFDAETSRTYAWQGIEAPATGDIGWPAYLADLPDDLKSMIGQAITQTVEAVGQDPRAKQTPTVVVTLNECPGAEYRVGDDRVTPGDARSDIYLHHAKRYAFSTQFCEGKRVLEVGGGTGYGARILSRHAEAVVSVDLSSEAMAFGNRTFGVRSVARVVSDARSIALGGVTFDTAVCFEMIEHIEEHDALLDEIRRLLSADGTFIVSTPNKIIYDAPGNENEYHVGMLSREEFENLMRRHFEDVTVVAQRRALPSEPFYEAFGFDAEATDDHEVFIAVCQKPRAKALTPGDMTPGDMTPGDLAPAVSPRIEVRESEPESARRETVPDRRLRVLFSHVSNPISAGRYYVDAFRRHCDVITCGPMIDDNELEVWREAEHAHAFKDMDDADRDKLERIRGMAEPCDIPMPRGRVNFDEVLKALPDGWTPDLFVWSDSATGFLPVGLEQLGCPTACLVGDTHTGQMDWRIDYARLFTHTFVMFNRQHIPHFQRAGVSNVTWLPGACDPTFHSGDAGEKLFDVGFVGQTHRTWHPDRVRLLQQMMDDGVDVRVESKILDEMGHFHGQSRIVFNRSLSGDLNMRVFEALCSGSLLLTDRLGADSGLEDLFEDRKHLVLYDEENLESLVDHYLEHTEEREAIAMAGREAILEAHTYDHRVAQILETVLESRTEDRTSKIEDRRSKIERPVSVVRGGEDPIAELATYTGETVAQVESQMGTAGRDLAEVWREQDRSTPDRIDAFYKETDRYLYDLTAFNYGPMVTGWRGAIYNLCQQVSEQAEARGFDVLDFGGGIGSTLLEIADLPGIRATYADLAGPTFDYAEWRFARRDLSVSTVDVTDPAALDGREFDVITCLDVIEHLPDPEAAVRQLISRLRPGGLLVLTVTFYTNEQGPFHLNCDTYTNESFYEIVKSLGMKELTPFAPRVFQKVETAVAVEPANSGPVFDTKADVDRFLGQWSGDIRLNLGCGADRREGYINVDAFVETADLRLDIFDLPLASGSVDEMFSSHMLEHLGKYEVPKALAEWHRVLKDGGRIRLNLPDLEWMAQHWLDQPDEQRWGWALDALYGLQTHAGEHHKTGFTVARVEQLLADAGFNDVVVTWTWSHGVRCVWAEGVRSVTEQKMAAQGVEMDRFATQFTRDFSDLFPYQAADVALFLRDDDWRFGFVAFEHLTADGSVRGVNVALKRDDRQMVLQGLRVAGDRLSFPSYLDDLSEGQRAKIGERIGSALQTVMNSPGHRNDSFVFANFGEDGHLGLEKTGERVIPGLTELSLYIPHVKRYLLAQTFASGKRVLDAGCGAGYGTKLLANVAERVDAVDIDPEAVAFCQRTFVDEKIDWSVGDLRSFEPVENTYDLVTSFEVIEHLTREEIPGYLERIRTSLKPGGVALISTPNRLVAEQWQNPFHHAEMTLEEFRSTLETAFNVQAVLGQTQWSPQVELQGQCAISRRLTDEDDMFIAVCAPLPDPVETDQPEKSVVQRSNAVVDVVIPLYNKAAYTRACLEGLEATRGDVSYNLVLVDNASTDETPQLLSEWIDRADVVRSSENLGFARGNNLGASRGSAPYVLFLNNDTVPDEGWLDALVAEIEQDVAIGIVGAKLVYPGKRDVQHAGLEIVNGTPDHVFRHAKENDSHVIEPRDLDMVTGACLMIRRDLFEALGGFDEVYVNGVEDVDLCLRARDRGYRVRYCPSSVLVHHEGTSEGRYDHVQPNLIKFAQRFQSRFDGQGRFIPILKTPVTEAQRVSEQSSRRVATPARPAQDAEGSAGRHAPVEGLRGIWEGTQFVHHSLSIVNTALVSELIGREDVELSLVPYEPATFGPDVDPERLGPVAARLNAPLSGPPRFHVRHKWPPDFAAPPSGHWIVIQPWEFGRIPAAWVEPIQTKVDEIWVPSEYARRCYLDSGIDANRVYVVPNGVDVARFTPDAKPVELPTEKSFKFLFVGGTIYRKGIDILLKTYRETFSADDDVCLVIKGMGDESFYKGQTAGDLIREIQADETAPEVVYLTEVLGDDEIAGLYTACDCLVHPYRGEGFGMPVAEAMACGLPVVVTQGGATDDFCTPETSYGVRAKRCPIAFQEETAGQAWLLDPDAEHLSALMTLVLAEPEAARQRGLKASEYVRNELTWARAADRIVERLTALKDQPVRREGVLERVPVEGPVVARNGKSELNGQTRDTNGVARTIPETEKTGGDHVDILILPGPEGDATYASHAIETRTGASVAGHHSVCPQTDETIGAALNRVLNEVSSEFLVILRSDVVVTDGWIDRLMAPLRAVDDVAATVPSLPIGPDGQRVKAPYKSVKKALTRFASQRAEKDGTSFDIESVSAACVVLRTSAVRALGGFEATMVSDAFIDDLLRRFRQQGQRAICVPTAFVHAEGADTLPLDEVRERKAVAALSNGDVLRAQGDREGALALYREALDLKPVYLEAALIASAVLLELDRPLEAAEPFEVLEACYPDSARVKNYRGRCLFRAGEWEDAQQLFEDALATQPDFAEALGNLGVLFWEKGDLDQAVEYLGRAAEIAPTDPDIVYNVGMVYSQLGQTAEAASVLAHFLSLEPDNLDARVHLAVLLIDTGDVDAGVGHLEAVLAEHPEHEDATRVVGELQTILNRASEGEA